MSSDLKKKIGLDDYFLNHTLNDFEKLETQKFTASEFLKYCKMPYTEVGNAELLALLMNNDIRYDTKKQSWYKWNGHYWAETDDFEMIQRAKEMCRLRQREASNEE